MSKYLRVFSQRLLVFVKDTIAFQWRSLCNGHNRYVMRWAIHVGRWISFSNFQWAVDSQRTPERGTADARSTVATWKSSFWRISPSRVALSTCNSAVVASKIYSNSRSPLVFFSHNPRAPSDLRMSSLGVSLNCIALVSVGAAQFTQSKYFYRGKFVDQRLRYECRWELKFMGNSLGQRAELIYCWFRLLYFASPKRTWNTVAICNATRFPPEFSNSFHIFGIFNFVTQQWAPPRTCHLWES